jgi:2-keto-4-pentenoate hydratase/2-oxohepta-3-ene-1,7-dioic acid hydratase in catechol pathway
MKMNFVTFEANGKTAIGILTKEKDYVIPLQAAEQFYTEAVKLPDTMQELLDQGDQAVATVQKIMEQLDDACPKLPLSSVHLLAPIPRPRKNIFCIGKNYAEHAKEFEKTADVSVAVPKVPVVFSKPPTCVVGPGAVVRNYNELKAQVDYEVELAVVIGKTASHVAKADAYDYVFGYTIINDVTARDLQKAHSQWIMGKGPDTFAPLGPWIVHKTAIANPHNLYIKSTINGELRQNGNTKDMIFDIPTLITTISSVITLEPGDIIATGTPAGVGAGFNPPRFLQPGDEMRLEVEGIGELVNTIEK